ncbi:MAG: polysaccharide deacetylase family protein, partial [Bacteroidales bacterium]|nr:polysaccharide deacetylase family protein [Bacteroidales bacterium]
MRTICLYFQIHQPFRFRKFRFFEIGNEHYYYDDYLNESILRKVSEKCYLPANKLMLSLINKYKGKFKLSFSISGIALDQFELYAPEVIDSFRELAKTGSVEFLTETYAHSLVALKSKDEFARQVEQHREKIKSLFGVEPKIFRNTELIYSDEIGSMVYDMGYEGMLTEGAKHVLGWRSPNFLYTNAINPKLKILLKNFKLSDDIAFRFSNKSWNEYPLTADKYAAWLGNINKNEEIVNLFMDYETFGEHQWAETGIFEFLKALPGQVLKKTNFTFSTPSEIIRDFQPIGSANVPYPISWADEERDLTAWLGNPLQEQAFNKLYSLLEKVRKTDDPKLQKDYQYLQVSDHFYYMATKFFSDGDVHSYFNPYSSPYEAFINYMNILSDFEIRLNALMIDNVSEDVMRLSKIIEEKNEIIRKYENSIIQKPVKKAGTSRASGTLKAPAVPPGKKAAAKPEAKVKATVKNKKVTE